MGGIKNHIQSYGVQSGKGFSGIEDPLERHAAFMGQQVTPYCKGCGKQLIDTEQDESGATIDHQAEQQRLMCTKCYNNRMEQLKKIQAQQAQQKPAIPDWEEYKKQFTRE
jgi:hypothetical protein